MPLILVGTPIGNLGDLSPRAAEALATADVVCCEDTRRTGRLFQLAGIQRTAKLVRVDDHTEIHASRVVIAPWFLAHGKITDRVADFAARQQISMCAPLGSHNLVAATVLDRYDAVAADLVAA